VKVLRIIAVLTVGPLSSLALGFIAAGVFLPADGTGRGALGRISTRLRGVHLPCHRHPAICSHSTLELARLDAMTVGEKSRLFLPVAMKTKRSLLPSGYSEWHEHAVTCAVPFEGPVVFCLRFPIYI
jgi:hypothetical protein